MFKITSSGSFKNTDNFLKTILRGDIFSSLDAYGRAGVQALASATPVDSGVTAESWNYEVKQVGKSYQVTWFNDHLTEDGTPVAILLQYGHGTGTGGYVQGEDFINPAIKPIFDDIANNIWKAVTSA